VRNLSSGNAWEVEEWREKKILPAISTAPIGTFAK
jgi:hypothetical protein